MSAQRAQVVATRIADPHQVALRDEFRQVSSIGQAREVFGVGGQIVTFLSGWAAFEREWGRTTPAAPAAGVGLGEG